MDRERILSRKLEKLDELKLALVSRGNREEIIGEIKETEEDLEAILMDLGYINDDREQKENSFKTYRCYRDLCE